MTETVTGHARPTVLPTLVQHAHWLPRAVLAGTFLFHGYDKFGAGLGNVADAFGFPVLVAFLVAAGELAVGAALLAGGTTHRLAPTATRAAGLGMAVIMVGAIAIVHWGRWAFAPADGYPAGGMEYQTLLAATGLYLTARGRF